MKNNVWLIFLLFLPLISGCGAVSEELTSITIAPGSASLIIGMTQQFTATGRNGLGDIVPLTAAWSVSDTAIGTIETTSGLFYANATGEVNVMASGSSVTASVPVTVASGELVSISVSPDTVELNRGEYQQFTAVGHNSVGGEITIFPTWEATGGVGTIGATSGYFTAEAVGTGSVIARYMGLSSSAAVAVTWESHTVYLTPEACTVVGSMAATTNWGATAVCGVGIRTSDGSRLLSYVRFDLSSIPSGASIEAASLTIYVTEYSGSIDNKIKIITGSWVETVVTYNTPPAYGEVILSSIVSGNGEAEFTDDAIGELVALWKSGSLTNNGIVLMIDPADTNAAYYLFAGRTSVFPERRPKLSVTYLY
ncbi:DNRLRE domain-containing protein [Candidatus Margulisiibacteriota bacterium]